MARTFCLECGTITRTTRCPTCQRQRDRDRYARKGHRYRTGNYQTNRAALNLDDPTTCCAVCHRPAHPNDPLQADHTHQMVDGGSPDGTLRPVHRSYNARRGAGLHNPYCTPPPTAT